MYCSFAPQISVPHSRFLFALIRVFHSRSHSRFSFAFLIRVLIRVLIRAHSRYKKNTPAFRPE